MNLNDIIERFTLVSGMTMSDASRYLPLIADCRAFFEERISGDLTAAQSRRAAQACAVYAYYRLCLLMRDTGLGTFKAGDVQIGAAKHSEQCAAAERMWTEERGMVADLGDFDDAFAFRSVSV